LNSKKLTHLDDSGQARMVDVGNKPDTERMAVARGEVRLQASTLALIREGLLKKGDVLGVAQIAGILGAKKTAELIPLCHPVVMNHIAVEVELADDLPGVRITATARATGKTGVEMEALTAVSVAALTVYDMVKAVEKNARIENIRLVEKHGGLSGDVHHERPDQSYSAFFRLFERASGYDQHDPGNSTGGAGGRPEGCASGKVPYPGRCGREYDHFG
jgi:cyclic pyranopterin phosphate synthase